MGKVARGDGKTRQSTTDWANTQQLGSRQWYAVVTTVDIRNKRTLQTDPDVFGRIYVRNLQHGTSVGDDSASLDVGGVIESAEPRATQVAEITGALSNVSFHELGHLLGLTHAHALGAAGVSHSDASAILTPPSITSNPDWMSETQFQDVKWAINQMSMVALGFSAGNITTQSYAPVTEPAGAHGDRTKAIPIEFQTVTLGATRVKAAYFESTTDIKGGELDYYKVTGAKQGDKLSWATTVPGKPGANYHLQARIGSTRLENSANPAVLQIINPEGGAGEAVRKVDLVYYSPGTKKIGTGLFVDKAPYVYNFEIPADGDYYIVIQGQIVNAANKEDPLKDDRYDLLVTLTPKNPIPSRQEGPGQGVGRRGPGWGACDE
jgi:hypothetical protein